MSSHMQFFPTYFLSLLFCDWITISNAQFGSHDLYND